MHTADDSGRDITGIDLKYYSCYMIHISLRQVFGGSETSFPKSQTSHLIIERTSSLLDHGLTFSFINVLATNTTFQISYPFNKTIVVTFHLQDTNNSGKAIHISQGCDTGNSECSSGLLDAPSFLPECPFRYGPLLQGLGFCS